MGLNIVQGFYSEEMKRFLDPRIRHLDTRPIEGASKEGEIVVIEKCLSGLDWSDGETFGYLPWAFAQKTGMEVSTFAARAKELLDRGYDCVFHNPSIFGKAFFGNPYVQGELSGHKSMIFWAKNLGIFDTNGYYAMSNFVVGNRNFWSFFREFHYDFVSHINKSGSVVTEFFNADGNYRKGRGFANLIFFRERLLANILAEFPGMVGEVFLTESEFKLKYEPLSNLKALFESYCDDTLASYLGNIEPSAAEKIAMLSLDDPWVRL